MVKIRDLFRKTPHLGKLFEGLSIPAGYLVNEVAQLWCKGDKERKGDSHPKDLKEGWRELRRSRPLCVNKPVE